MYHLCMGHPRSPLTTLLVDFLLGVLLLNGALPDVRMAIEERSSVILVPQCILGTFPVIFAVSS